MSAGHTSGPWTVSQTLTGALSIGIEIGNLPIATVGGSSWHLGVDTCAANARLIAAAPDLLAALTWAVEAADTEQYESCWYAAARAAIASATGAA